MWVGMGGPFIFLAILYQLVIARSAFRNPTPPAFLSPPSLHLESNEITKGNSRRGFWNFETVRIIDEAGVLEGREGGRKRILSGLA
jgi:hypothetical protein